MDPNQYGQEVDNYGQEDAQHHEGQEEFEGYDQAEMFAQQQDQPFYAEDLRQQDQNGSNMRYFHKQGLGAAAQSQSLSRTQQHENVGRLLQIACGKAHNLNLTRDGDVFSMGSGEQCVSGHGGSLAADKPQILKPLRDKRVSMIACGDSHSMVMTDRGYLYTWGRGFEGQLGLSETIEVAATPSFVKFFHNKKRILNVQYIAAGSFYSLAIVEGGKLYAWGEARMGQLGLGKAQVVKLPTKVQFPPDEQGKKVRIKACSAGFGHTAALADSGDLYQWGFSIYGQTGFGDTKTRWYPEQVCNDVEGQPLPKFNKIACSKFGTFALDVVGKPYSWGQGYLGHGGKCMVKAPKMIVQPSTKQGAGTESRIFTDIFASDDGCLFYAPIRIYDVFPRCGPSKGNTVIQIVGTGLQDSDKLKVRFTYGDLSREVPCHYDVEGQVIVCRTPLFEEFDGEAHPSLKMPCDCFISVTMDGINYSECEVPFKIYSNDINLTSVFPKCSSVQGGTTVTFNTNIDEETAQFLTELKIGLRPKRSTRSSMQSQMQENVSSSQKHLHKNSYQSLGNASNQVSRDQNQVSMLGGEEAIGSGASQGAAAQGGSGMKMAASTYDDDSWVTTQGFFENGKIIAKIPKLDNFDPDQLQYSIDVALNGQQYTGKPVNFRYYDVNVQHVIPNIGPAAGGTNIMIAGTGLYDAGCKKIKFTTADGSNCREVQADWDKTNKAFRVTVPPHLWLFGEQAAREREEEEEEMKSCADGEGPASARSKKENLITDVINVSLTLNNQEWINALSFTYHDFKLTRLAYVHNFGEALAEEEERVAKWFAEEPEEPLPEEITEEEIKKRDEEKAKRAAEETEEVATVAKRKGYKMYLFGENLIKGNQLQIIFTFQQEANEEQEAKHKVIKVTPIYKNPNMVAFTIPDMGEEVPVGNQTLSVEATMNGQNFTSCGLTFMYNSVDPALTEEDLRRMEEEEAKGAKKGAPKKR